MASETFNWHSPPLTFHKHDYTPLSKKVGINVCCAYFLSLVLTTTCWNLPNRKKPRASSIVHSLDGWSHSPSYATGMTQCCSPPSHLMGMTADMSSLSSYGCDNQHATLPFLVMPFLSLLSGKLDKGLFHSTTAHIVTYLVPVLWKKAQDCGVLMKELAWFLIVGQFGVKVHTMFDEVEWDLTRSTSRWYWGSYHHSDGPLY